MYYLISYILTPISVETIYEIKRIDSDYFIEE